MPAPKCSRRVICLSNRRSGAHRDLFPVGGEEDLLLEADRLRASVFHLPRLDWPADPDRRLVWSREVRSLGNRAGVDRGQAEAESDV